MNWIILIINFEYNNINDIDNFKINFIIYIWYVIIIYYEIQL